MGGCLPCRLVLDGYRVGSGRGDGDFRPGRHRPPVTLNHGRLSAWPAIAFIRPLEKGRWERHPRTIMTDGLMRMLIQ